MEWRKAHNGSSLIMPIQKGCEWRIDEIKKGKNVWTWHQCDVRTFKSINYLKWCPQWHVFVAVVAIAWIWYGLWNMWRIRSISRTQRWGRDGGCQWRGKRGEDGEGEGKAGVGAREEEEEEVLSWHCGPMGDVEVPEINWLPDKEITFSQGGWWISCRNKKGNLRF